MAYRIGQVGDRILYAPTYRDAEDARNLLDADPQLQPATLTMVEALVSDHRPVRAFRARMARKPSFSLVDELAGMPVRQAGGAACLKERNVMLVAERGDAVIKRLRAQVRRLKDEVRTLRSCRKGNGHA